MSDDHCNLTGPEHLDQLANIADRIDREANGEGHLLSPQGLQHFVVHNKDHFGADAHSEEFQLGMLAAAALIGTAPMPGFILEPLGTAILDTIGQLRLASGKAKTDAAFEDIIKRLDGEKGDDAAGYI